MCGTSVDAQVNGANNKKEDKKRQQIYSEYTQISHRSMRLYQLCIIFSFVPHRRISTGVSFVFMTRCTCCLFFATLIICLSFFTSDDATAINICMIQYTFVVAVSNLCVVCVYREKERALVYVIVVMLCVMCNI